MPMIMAAPFSSARTVAPSQVAEFPIWPGARIVCRTTALPRTSRPRKSASEPVPTQTASSRVPSGIGVDPLAGRSEPKVSWRSPPVAVNSQSTGVHCGGRSKCWRRMFSIPSSSKIASDQSAVIPS